MKYSNIPSKILNDSDVSPSEPTLIHSYPGSMPAYLASRLADRYSIKNDVVFDPFCGSGVVLAESAKLGRQVIGTDLLEISTEIAKAALSLQEPDIILERWNEIHERSVKRTSLFSDSRINLEQLSEHHKNLSIWYHKETLVQLISVYEEVKILQENDNRFFSLILSSALISLSNRASKGVLHWGWIADNVKPKEFDLLKTDVFAEISKRIGRIVRFLKATGGQRLLSTSISGVFQHNWTSTKELDAIERGSVDLLLTSPPYPYSIDYTLSLRLSHYLFEKPFDLARKNEIGARFKRKRKDRAEQYFHELGLALKKASIYVKIEGKAVFVLPHPDEYKSVSGYSLEEWLEFLRLTLSGEWVLVDLGFRECVKRRVVNKAKAIRQELIVAYKRLS